MSEETPAISFSVKEFMAKIDKKLDMVIDRLESKADKRQVKRLKQRTHKRLRALETKAIQAAEAASLKRTATTDLRWKVSVAATVAANTFAVMYNLLHK